MRRAFLHSGQRSLFEDGLRKVKNGITTIDEILRVTEACQLPEAAPAQPQAVS